MQWKTTALQVRYCFHAKKASCAFLPFRRNTAGGILRNGYVFDGPMFNIYHVSPHETSNPGEYVTEVCYPVKKA